MKFTMTKIAAAAVLATAAMSAQAVEMATWQLGDINGDGLISDFAFFAPPSGSSSNKFGPTGEMCGAAACAPIALGGATQGVQEFSMGFNFGGTGMFEPITYGSGINADITGGALTFSSLDFGGMFGGTQFSLAPDNLAAINVESLIDNGDGSYGVQIRYVGTINQPGSPFHTWQANWRLEGTMAPVPEASTYGMMLAGLGLVGFAVRRRKLMA